MKRAEETENSMARNILLQQRTRVGKSDSTGVPRVQPYIELLKIRIALFAGLSAATGSILVNSALSQETFISSSGVFLLACGAGTLNQFQERERDALFARTRSRPLPMGKIAPIEALYTAAIFLLAGLTILSLAGPVIASCLGIAGVLWYNLVYTNLKKVTPFAAVPGALTGALPPAIGWTAAGGSITDIRLAALCFFFFMWQVPHFWLLLLHHAEDFKRAQMSSLHTVFGQEQLTKITALWMAAASVSSLLIPFYGINVPPFVTVMLVCSAVWLGWCGLTLPLRKKRMTVFANTFRSINIYVVLVMLLLSAGSIISL